MRTTSKNTPPARITMEVIPLTLIVSLLLSLTFIALFLREFTRPRRVGAERDSLLPFESEFVSDAVLRAPVAASRESSSGSVGRHDHDHDHHGAGRGEGDACSGGRPGAACCSSCRRRKENRERRDAARNASPSPGGVVSPVSPAPSSRS